MAWHLIDAGYTVELDCWNWAAGDNFVTKMGDALQNARRVLALFSSAYFEASRYTTDEWSAALVKDEDGGHRLLPVLIESCDVPRLLQPLLWADLYGVAEDEALRRLLAAARGPVGPSGRPTFPPSTASRRPEASDGPAPRLPGSLPPVWNIQQRNPAFVGREAALAELRERLLGGGTAVARALRGMGGIGKTQLAVEYAHRFAGTYQLAWWIIAQRTELIPTQLADLAVETGIAERTMEVPAAVGALQADLRHRPGWLLVFDNAEDPAVLQPWLPNGPGHVLITSRNPNWGEIAAPVDVPVFAAAESVALLRRRVPGITEADAGQVATTLDNLPLALAQAAGVLSETGLPANAYLDHLAVHAADILTEGTPTSYDQSLAATVGYAANQLTDADHPAGILLRLSANLGPEPIPTSLFTAGAAALPEALAAIATSPLKLHQSLGLISRYGLAHLDQSGLQVHRLVQAILRDLSTPKQRDDDARCIQALLIAAGPTDTDDPATWPTWANLLPHLLAANPVDSTSPDLRRLAARALLYLLRRGDSQTAEQLAATFFENWTRLLGPDHPDTLTAATELAHARLSLGRLSEVRELVEDTLARRRRTLGDDHPDTLRSASDLSFTLNDLGELQAARELGEDTLARRRRILGDDHPDTLRSASNLAICLDGLGEVQAARELAEDTLARRRRILGDDHPDTLTSAGNLAICLDGLGEVQAARELAEDTLARRRRILGDDHPDTITSASNLAIYLNGLGEVQAARELGEDTLARRRRILGDDHPNTLTSASNLAIYLNGLGELQAARELAEDTLARQRRILGDDHPDTLTSAGNLAICLNGLGELQAARELAEDTLARQRRILGDDHPNTITSASNLAIYLDRLGEVQAARELGEDTLARRRRILGDDHPGTLTSAGNLAIYLDRLGERQAARKLAEDTLARRRRILGDDHPGTLTSAGNLAMYLDRLGERQAARKLAEDTLARQRRILGDDHPGTLNTAYMVTGLLLNSRNLLGARILADQTLAKYKKTLGLSHPDTQRMAQLQRRISAALGGQPKASRPKDRKKTSRPKDRKKKRR